MLNSLKERFRRRKNGAASKPSNPRTGTNDLTPTLTELFKTTSTATSFLQPAATLNVASLPPRANPLGLSLIVDPRDPVADIIFVHGLGGTSHNTWSRDRNPALFWPKQWLPDDLPHARIHTFGYNSNFASTKSSTYGVFDFAKQLLFEIKYSPCDFGKYPIIFVAHSMGGLLVKKVYTLAKQDLEYQTVFPKFFGIVFLATPHRGSNFAQTLQNMLRLSPNHSVKGYLDDLAKNSVTLQNINEDFRHVEGHFKLVSFYESLRTHVGVKDIMVVEKDSATLGYRGEISAALNADHHTICKFSGPADSNYISVKNVLVRLVRECQEQVTHSNTEIYRSQMETVFKLFTYSESPEDELLTYQQLRLEGSCEWILEKDYFQEWLDGDAVGTQLLWLTGLPASGKSVLSAYIVNHIQRKGKDCQYFFFHFGESMKCTSGSLLRSIAAQLAVSYEPVRESLVTLYDEGIRLGNAETRMIWQKAFVATIFRIQFPRPLYWVIDALDEAESSTSIVQTLGNMQNASASLRILVMSRRTDALANAFHRLHTIIPVSVESIGVQDTLPDIKSYVVNAVDVLPGNEETRQGIIDKVLEKSAGCFLWVRLAIEEVQDVGHTQAGIRTALEDVPAEMDKLYQRAFDTISRLHPQNQNLAKEIIRWTICAVRPLTLEELEYALLPSFGQILDIERTIVSTCAHLLVVDHRRRVLPVHLTVRDFLLKNTHSEFGIVKPRDHETIARACLDFLNKECSNLVSRSAQTFELRPYEGNPFAKYAASSWSDHLRLATADSEMLLDSLVIFFKNTILTWIAFISTSSNLHTLTRTARHLKAFIERRNKLPSPTTILRTSDSGLAELWAIDLIRLVTKFGNHLIENPSVVFNLLPPICPKQTIIYRQFGSVNKDLSVSGLSMLTWNDRICRIPAGEIITAIASGDVYFALALASGTIMVLNVSTCQECRRFEHSETISSLQFNSTSDKLVSGGTATVKVWDVNLGRQTHVFDPGHKVISVAFLIKNTSIFAACCNNTVKTWDLLEDCEVNHFRWVETETPGRYHGFPIALALHAECGRVAVSYRGFPVSLWEIESQRLLGQVIRRTRTGRGNAVIQDTAFCLDVNRVTGHLVLGYSDGTMLKWDPVTDEQQECDADANSLSCSDDGLTIGTGDSDGNIKLWSFATLELIHHIRTYDDPVEYITFSPNGLRVYDIRGTDCSVWEPDALVRPTKPDDDQSSFGPVSAEFTDATASQKVPIRSLVCDTRGEFCAYGREDGCIYLANAATGCVIQQIYGHAATVSIVAHAWSPSGDLMATADNSRRFILRRLTQDPDSAGPHTWESIVLADSRAANSIQQLLFSSDEKTLFVFTSGACEIWTAEGDKLRSVTFDVDQNGEWANLPMNPSQLLCLKCDQASFFYSETLQILQPSLEHFDLRTSQDSEASIAEVEHRNSEEVTKIISYSGGHLLVIEVSSRVYAPGSASIFVWNLALTMEPPKPIIRNVEALVGIYETKVVFLDKYLWVCSWDLENQTDIEDFGYERHFFLPQDWINGREAQRCILTGQGNLVFATGGELAVIKGGLLLKQKSKFFQPGEMRVKKMLVRAGTNPTIDTQYGESS